MTAQKEAYLVIDVGTGNVRVAVADENGEVLAIARDNVIYEKDELYPDALYFNADALWDQILALTRQSLSHVPGVAIRAITVSSQREGVVLLGDKGESLIGLPNHDHRGREWEDTVVDKDIMYKLTGRYPSSLFSALKLMGLKGRRDDLFRRLATLVSISDWVQYKLSGIAVYEHSQASETLLYNVAARQWSDELCAAFGLDTNILPELCTTGTVLGKILPEYATQLKISSEALIVAGGADTQLAIKSTRPAVGDIVIVAGTTTPVTRIVGEYITDDLKRTWTNSHIEAEKFILETNAGITGLNYQRLKEIFYPNESYEVIEKELAASTRTPCVASLGSLISDEKKPSTKGGFIFNVPVSHQLTRAHFISAVLWDIACAVKENYDTLCEVTNHRPGYVWACGGGMQSRTLAHLIADLLNVKVRIRPGFMHASVVGGTLVCNEACGIRHENTTGKHEIDHACNDTVMDQYWEWKEIRNGLKNSCRVVL